MKLTIEKKSGTLIKCWALHSKMLVCNPLISNTVKQPFLSVVYHAFLWGLFGRKKRSVITNKKGYKNEVSTVYCAAKSITHFFTILYGIPLSLPSEEFPKEKSIFTHKRNRLKRRTSRESISQPFGVLLCHKLLEGGAEKILLSQSFFYVRRSDGRIAYQEENWHFQQKTKKTHFSSSSCKFVIEVSLFLNVVRNSFSNYLTWMLVGILIVLKSSQ